MSDEKTAYDAFRAFLLSRSDSERTKSIGALSVEELNQFFILGAFDIDKDATFLGHTLEYGYGPKWIELLISSGASKDKVFVTDDGDFISAMELIKENEKNSNKHVVEFWEEFSGNRMDKKWFSSIKKIL